MINQLLRRGRRSLYGMRSLVPGLRFQHEIEQMIGPVGYWRELETYQFELIKVQGLRPEHRLLDLGCGPLQGGIPLIGYLKGGGYCGVDISEPALAAGHRRIHECGLAGKSPWLLHSSCFGDDLLGAAAFDFIWASQILYYFDAGKLAEMMAFVRRRLRPGGKFLGDMINPEDFDRVNYHRSRFIRQSREAIEAAAETAGLRMRVLGQLREFGYPRRLLLNTSLLLELTARD